MSKRLCVKVCLLKAPCVKAFVCKSFCVYFYRTRWNCLRLRVKMLASASVLGRVELGSFGVVICVGIDMFIVSFTVQFACLCDNDVCMSNAGVVVSGFEEHILCIALCECVAG